MFEAAIITASDKGARGERDDISGPTIAEILLAASYHIHSRVVLPDNQELLSAKMQELVDEDVALILTSGGTGFSPRDFTPEATLAVIERQAPGISKRSLIVNLLGSPKAVRECLNFVLPELEHGLKILRGEASECAR